MFHPLELPDRQFHKLSLYTEMRDTYHDLYKSEATEHKEFPNNQWRQHNRHRLNRMLTIRS